VCESGVEPRQNIAWIIAATVVPNLMQQILRSENEMQKSEKELSEKKFASN